MYRKIAILVVVFTISAFGFASVSFAQDATATPTATAQATARATAQATAQPTAQATAGSQMQGTNPGNAGPVTSSGQSLGVGEQRWYRFQYAGDNSEIQVRMNTNPGSSANFSVWTEENLRNWQQGGPEQPVGRGSANEDRGGDMFWSGSFNTAGPVYIRVDQMGATPSNYTLSVTGTGVSMGQQSQAQAATQAQSGTQTPSGTQAQSSTQAQVPASSPQTLPVTGGDLTLLVAGLGALSLAAGAGLRRFGKR